MSEALILEFGEATQDQYNDVNNRLGIDPSTGAGDWPDGLLSHTGALTPAGGILVFELWDTQESQGRFMQDRLGPALHAAALPEPTRVEWLTIVGNHQI
jgi:hypothetical protein